MLKNADFCRLVFLTFFMCQVVHDRYRGREKATFVIHKKAPTYVLTLFHIPLISINIIYLVMSILLCTFVTRKERYNKPLNF